MIPAGVLLVALSTLAGWVVLAPVSRRLGPVWYHLLAYPVGLLAWLCVEVAASLAGSPYSPAIAAAGLIAFMAAGLAGFAAIARDRASSSDLPRIPWWTFPVAALTVLGFAAAASAFGVSFITDDSIMAYDVLGIWLHDTGRLTVRLVSERSFLVPGIHAATRLLGGDRGFVHYPVAALATVLVAGMLLWDAAAGLPLRARIATSVVPALLMALTPAFVFHSLYVHSHMLTALFLLVAIAALWKATGGRADGPDAAPEWMAVSGLASAGITMTRTDGLAYVLVVVLVAVALYLSTGMRRHALVAYFAALLAVAVVPYAAAFLENGVWSSGKLGGAMTLALLALLAAIGVVAVVLGSSAYVRRYLGARRGLIALVLAVDALAVAALAALNAEGFAKAAGFMAGNLLKTGGYQSFWFVAVPVVLIVAVDVRRRLRDDWLRLLLFAVAQFFVIAIVVHGTRHPGRLSPSDSFNRVAFHALPLIFVTAGLWAQRLVPAALGAKAAAPSVVESLASPEAETGVDRNQQ